LSSTKKKSTRSSFVFATCLAPLCRRRSADHSADFVTLLRFPASKRGEALEPVSAADQTESIQNRLGECCVLNSFRQDGGHIFEITADERR
jgi:hypothetical protein